MKASECPEFANLENFTEWLKAELLHQQAPSRFPRTRWSTHCSGHAVRNDYNAEEDIANLLLRSSLLMGYAPDAIKKIVDDLNGKPMDPVKTTLTQCLLWLSYYLGNKELHEYVSKSDWKDTAPQEVWQWFEYQIKHSDPSVRAQL